MRLRTFLVLMVVVGLATWLRLFHLGAHDLRGDEAFSISLAQGSWVDIVQVLRTTEPHPPLYYLGLKVWSMLAGESEFAARWPSAAWGIALVPLVFALCRKFKSPATGVVAAVVVAVNPYLIWNSQDARMYAMAATFSTPVLYFGIRMGGPGRPRRRDAWGLAVASLLALHTHYVTAVVVLAVHGLVGLRWLYCYRVDRGPLHLWAKAFGATALLCLPWLVLALPVLGPSYAGTGYSPDLLTAMGDVLRTFAVGEYQAAPVADWAGPALALPAALGIVALWRSQPMVAITITLTVALPFLALLLASSTRPVFNARYLLATAPALYVLYAVGLMALKRFYEGRKRWRLGLIAWPLAAATAAALITFTLSALHGYLDNYGNQQRGAWSASMAWLASAAGPADLVIVNNVDPAFWYYYRKAGGRAKATVQPARADSSDEELDRELGGLISAGRVVWLVPDGEQRWDKNGLAAAWLNRHTVRRAASQKAGMEFAQYRVPAGVRQPIAFGEVLRLEGFEVRGGKTEVAPGETLTIDLLWHATAPISEDFSVTLQLLDAGGRLAAQSDGPPANGKAATSSWRLTETIVDTRRIRMPDAPGAYALGLAVYRHPSLERLSVVGSPADLASLDVVHVVRS